MQEQIRLSEKRQVKALFHSFLNTNKSLNKDETQIIFA
jgi:hypothetical protein